MLLGRVVGTLVATRKEPSLDGLKLLVLRQLWPARGRLRSAATPGAELT